ncbi:MAG: response regulator transcription factor [Chloroflexi bacterium]|nr:response regulator transcription factor [Chloroflexota bacterium]
MTPITVVMADDHDVVRRGLEALLETEPMFRVVGEARTGQEAIELIKQHQPDILVIDIIMPGLNGLEVTRRTAQISPNTRVVVLSMYENEPYVLEALRAGAMAYVLKGSTAEDLVRAIREVSAGHYYLSHPLSKRALEVYTEKSQAPEVDPYDMLTSREREVLHLAAEGYNTTRIASHLSISPRTVETHRASSMRKLGLRTQADLIRYAIRRGILPPES